MGIIAALGWAWALIAWFGKRDVKRYDEGLKDIEQLKLTMVTRMQLDSTMAEFRSERREMHRENQNLLTQIRETIDSNEERDAKTRHDIRDEVHVLVSKSAVLDKRIEHIEQSIKHATSPRSPRRS